MLGHALQGRFGGCARTTVLGMVASIFAASFWGNSLKLILPTRYQAAIVNQQASLHLAPTQASGARTPRTKVMGFI